MPAEQRGSAFRTKTGWGVRWVEDGRRPQRTGFASKSAALAFFRDDVRPRLANASSVAPSSTLEAFVEIYLAGHALNVEASSLAILRDRLKRATTVFGDVPLEKLERQAPEIAAWRSTLAEGSRFGATQALRQVLEQAVRWGVIQRNPAKLAGPNPAPKRAEIHPFTTAELDAVCLELGDAWAPLVRFAAATGLRPCEWIPLERRDVKAKDGVVLVERSVSRGALKAYGKTTRSRRRVPLSQTAAAAIAVTPPRIDTPLLFPSPAGGLLDLHKSMRGHLPMAALESLTVFTDQRTKTTPIDEVTGFLSAIVIDTEPGSSTYGHASLPLGGPVFLTENAGGEDWWAVSFTLDGSKRKRLAADVVVWNSDVIDAADPVVQAKVAEQAWFDYTRWVLNEAGSAGVFIVLEIKRLIEMHVARGRFPPAGELGKVPFLVALENEQAREAAKNNFTNPRPL